MNKRPSPADLLLLTGWLALLVFATAHSTLALPYLSDDYEHATLVANIRAGLNPGRDLLLVPFHGQYDVLLRLLFWFGTMAGHMSLFWVRLGVAAAHIAGAVGCAILCARWTGSRFAAFVAGTVYAGALGFIGEQIWWPSSGIFCLGAAFFIFAIVALDANRLWICAFMLILAALSLNGILAAALALSAYYWLVRGKPPARLPLIVVAALYVAGILRIGASLRGFGLGAWLTFTAPFRFVTSFTTLSAGFRTVWELAPLAWIAIVASLWWIDGRQRRIVLFAWIPAILLAFVIGFARADYPFRFGPGSLYTADRYYYLFLFPLALQCALILNNFRWRSAAMALVLVALFGGRAHYLANVPRANFAASARALDRGRALVKTIRTSAVRPLLLKNQPIPLDGARNNTATVAFLVYSEYPGGIPGVRLLDDSVPDDALLTPWLPAPASYINFKDASYEQDLTSGFSWWEPPFRWMTGRASLHLIRAPGDLVIVAYAPAEQLHRTIHVTVAIEGKTIGQLAISQAGPHAYHLHPPDLPPGSIANIMLTSDTVWHARDIFPQSFDERDLSIAISRIGFMRP